MTRCDEKTIKNDPIRSDRIDCRSLSDEWHAGHRPATVGRNAQTRIKSASVPFCASTRCPRTLTFLALTNTAPIAFVRPVDNLWKGSLS